MSQEPEATVNDEMRPEYDFSGGVRGKYYEAYMQASNVVILDPDVAEIFGSIGFDMLMYQAIRVLRYAATSN